MNNKVVYVHKLNSEVVYVGSGCVKRTTNIAGRSEQHKKIWKDLEKVIIADNLSKEDSLELEQQLIDQYVVYGNLLNKSHQASPVKKIIYKDIVDLLEYDESSPTYLRWKIQCRKQTPPGSIAGHFGNFGYCVVQIKGKNYKGAPCCLLFKHRFGFRFQSPY